MSVIDGLPDVKTTLDVFTGTTRVAQAMRTSGLHVTTSDTAAYSQVFSECYIQGTQHDIDIVKPILLNIADNTSRDEPGWITQNYADVAGADGSVVRFIHPKNAVRADGIREEIERRKGLGRVPTSIMVTSLIEAIDRVDNTVGIQQAYLKDWCKRSLDDMELRVPVIPDGPIGSHICGDVLSIDFPEADLAYVDPPYSPHSYATYYHIWESVALWDKPAVGLRTNRRADRIGSLTPKSPWNTPEALSAFRALFERLHTKYLLVSYADDSKLVSRGDLYSLCTEFGRTDVIEIDYRRNIMSSIGNAANAETKVTKNHELLFLVRR